MDKKVTFKIEKQVNFKDEKGFNLYKIPYKSYLDRVKSMKNTIYSTTPTPEADQYDYTVFEPENHFAELNKK